MKTLIFARKPAKTALPATRSLHRAVVKFLREHEVSLSVPVRVYVNQGRGEQPDRVTILHLPPILAEKLNRLTLGWRYGSTGMEYGTKPVLVPIDKTESGLLVRLAILGGWSKCPLCPDGYRTMPFVKEQRPTIYCPECKQTRELAPPANRKARRHYRVALREC